MPNSFPRSSFRLACTAITTAALAFSILPLCAAPLPATEPEPTASPAAPAMPRPPVAAPRPAVPRTPATAVTPANRNPGRHAGFLDRIKEGPVGLLFLGDSITDGWNRGGEWTWSKFAKYDPLNLGISGERTEDVLWRIENGELEGIAPKVTVIMIGTNNLGANLGEKPEWTAAGVTKIVETVHQKLPETKVLLLGVFPRDKAGSHYRPEIKAINDIIAKLDDGDKTRYLDIGHVFLDEQGEIPRTIMPDLLHPNNKGYELWYDAMHPLLDEMLK